MMTVTTITMLKIKCMAILNSINCYKALFRFHLPVFYPTHAVAVICSVWIQAVSICILIVFIFCIFVAYICLWRCTVVSRGLLFVCTWRKTTGKLKINKQVHKSRKWNRFPRRWRIVLYAFCLFSALRASKWCLSRRKEKFRVSFCGCTRYYCRGSRVELAIIDGARGQRTTPRHGSRLHHSPCGPWMYYPCCGHSRSIRAAASPFYDRPRLHGIRCTPVSHIIRRMMWQYSV